MVVWDAITCFSDYFLCMGPILDTPCAAGARSDGLRPSTSSSKFQKNSEERVSHVRKRHIEKSCRVVPLPAWNEPRFQGSVFKHVAKKFQNEGPKSGPWTGRYQLLTFLRGVHFWILQNQKFKLWVDRRTEAPSISPSQKLIIFRTD